jgi:HAE1 family hydrophobic/amphiphilic exporter-1
VSDQSVSVRESIRDVQYSFALACALVMLVIVLFTRRLVPALVAGVALLLSLCGTFVGMWVLGFSLNNVTLLALTLAVGLVVDDAIVMLENIQRHTDRGMSPRPAAEKGAGEIGFTVISLTASLIAVFIPVLFMGGLIGRMLNEFAVTVALALGMSALVALFVTPALAGSLLAASPVGPRSASKVPFLHFYEATLRFALRFRFLVVLAFIATVVGTVFLAKSLPKGFFPREDLGQVVVTTEAQQDVSFEAMVSLQAEVEEALRRSPHVAHVVNQIGSAAGGGHLHQGRLIVELRPRQQRGDLDQVLDDLRLRTSEVPGLSSVVTSLQNMRGGRQGRSHYQLTLQSPDFQELAAASRRVVAAMSGDPSFDGVASDLQNEATHAVLRIDREKARLLGIRADQVRMALQHGFAESHLASFTRGGEVHKVLIEFDRRLIGSERALETLYVQSTDGPLVPISAFATVELTSGPSAINQTGVVPSVAISFDLAKGVSLGQAVHRIERIKDASAFPRSVASSFTGTAKAFQESLSNQGWLLLAALLAMYLVLGMLYESFIHPFTILAGVPSAAMGALVALHWAGLSLDAPALIGVLLLIGIAKKNAILIVDAALDRQRLGVSAEEAILQACRQRFRPIMMTTFAATAGVVPIAFGLGAGSELRQPLGVAVLGGLAVSQVLTLYLTPVLFLFFDSLSRRFRRLPVSGAGPSVRSTT